MEIREVLAKVKAETEAQKRAVDSCTFESYNLTNSNTEAYDACLEVARGVKDSNNLLYIYGTPRSGKTHLLHAIKNDMTANMTCRVKLLNADEFVSEVIWALRNGRDIVEYRNEYKVYDVFLLDDMQYLSNKERVLRLFFDILNMLILENRQVVLTADCLPKELVGFDERIVARLEWGRVVEIS